MSESKDWSPSYTAWKLMETILEANEVKPSDLGKDLLLDLFSDCVNAVSGEYVADLDDLDDEFDEDEFDDEIDDDNADA
ncbi:hypothetical protein [Ponticaulis sp.]|uniref:hypothetical protein n=1 Tax=Ponticaulis sp. TaxID=2020902 RepID=UPI000B64A69C|nr:hypothetical protein [Ponticaulis sp.]MAI91344.1 hypothetical protein [Ponticaulis sp.]OUX97943.1 MAG: hypothetical protein CBB65_12950 [Hyphomonadaceae bacterium TMED5]